MREIGRHENAIDRIKRTLSSELTNDTVYMIVDKV